MKRYLLQYLAVGLAIVLLFTLGEGSHTFAQEATADIAEVEEVSIVNPADGDTVSGLIIITGTATEFEDFLRYEFLLKAGDNMIFAAHLFAPVVDGNLARLDTRIFLDGTYQLVIRQVRSDGNYTDVLGPMFTIENGLGAPLPHPEIESNFLYPREGWAILRMKNCSGNNVEFDYKSPMGFCSADDLWMMPKDPDSPFCPFVDLLLIPCEYRGTVVGEGEPRGATYSFIAEAGKIYQLDYPGGGVIYLGEVQGDEQVMIDDSLQSRLPTTGEETIEQVSSGSEMTEEAVSSAEPPAAPAVEPEGEIVTPPTPSVGIAQETQPMLPVSGQEEISRVPFVVAGVGLLLLLIVGGVIAARKRGSAV